VTDTSSTQEVPEGLWERLRDDPVRAPEHVALYAAKLHAPAAAEWAHEKRSRYAASGHDLAKIDRKSVV
jgi:hypothetical protein